MSDLVSSPLPGFSASANKGEKLNIIDAQTREKYFILRNYNNGNTTNYSREISVASFQPEI
jgi:hypothetical protein